MGWSHNYNKRVDPHAWSGPAPRGTLFATRTGNHTRTRPWSERAKSASVGTFPRQKLGQGTVDLGQIAHTPSLPLLLRSNKNSSLTPLPPAPWFSIQTAVTSRRFYDQKSSPFFTFFIHSLPLHCYCYIWLRSWEALKSSICRLVFLFKKKKNLLNLFSLNLNGDWVESRCLASSQPVHLWFIWGREEWRRRSPFAYRRLVPSSAAGRVEKGVCFELFTASSDVGVDLVCLLVVSSVGFCGRDTLQSWSDRTLLQGDGSKAYSGSSFFFFFFWCMWVRQRGGAWASWVHDLVLDLR